MADTVVVDRGSNSQDNSAVGMVLALIVVLALVIGGVYLYRHGGARAANPGTNINVTLPAAGSSGGTTQ
ncbi:MAG: hypothetical protein JWM46_318 [Candidatus Kaiserbacteria bacterium]|nr:hypothetical protein [Candidatus Kaiserbacteria bacterium]